MARLSTLVAAFAALAVAPVHAASFATASLSDLKITLFDLKPSDGITPGITFDLRANNASVFAEDSANTRFSEAFGTGPFDLSVATPRSSASAAVAGRGPANVTSLTASGSALGPLAPGGSSSFSARAASPHLSSFASSEFTLTANTRVKFSGLANLEAITTIGGDESAFASALLDAFGPGPDGRGSQFSNAFLDAEISGGAAGVSLSSGLLTVRFDNQTGGDLAGRLSRDAFVIGSSSVVPEPETYAMMVAGLGLLGFMLRRRTSALRATAPSAAG